MLEQPTFKIAQAPAGLRDLPGQAPSPRMSSASTAAVRRYALHTAAMRESRRPTDQPVREMSMRHWANSGRPSSQTIRSA